MKNRTKAKTTHNKRRAREREETKAKMNARKSARNNNNNNQLATKWQTFLCRISCSSLTKQQIHITFSSVVRMHLIVAGYF